jgi:hypothetical protein
MTIEEAWAIVEQLCQDGWILRIVGPKCLRESGAFEDGWNVMLIDSKEYRIPIEDWADTFVLAIQQVVQKARGGEK